MPSQDPLNVDALLRVAGLGGSRPSPMRFLVGVSVLAENVAAQHGVPFPVSLDIATEVMKAVAKAYSGATITIPPITASTLTDFRRVEREWRPGDAVKPGGPS